jgi:hypothetical protein
LGTFLFAFELSTFFFGIRGSSYTTLAGGILLEAWLGELDLGSNDRRVWTLRGSRRDRLGGAMASRRLWRGVGIWLT